MNCNIIKDLLPLYVDDCCSEDSANVVSGHLEACPDCRKAWESMRHSYTVQSAVNTQISLRSISSWKASALQSVMLFVSFALLAFGVIMEGNTPEGLINGLWACALIVPATGYLLSLANWFFVRVYTSRKAFSNGSCIATLGLTILGYVWAAIHYPNGISLTAPLVWIGFALSAILCLLSKVLSNQYALLLGRE